MKYNDTFKSSSSIDTTITAFIDITQNNNVFLSMIGVCSVISVICNKLVHTLFFNPTSNKTLPSNRSTFYRHNNNYQSKRIHASQVKKYQWHPNSHTENISP